MQDPVAVEDVPQLERAGRPPFSDQGDLPEYRTVGLGPVIEELGDHLVEVFVSGTLGLVDVIVDVPQGHRPEDRLLGRTVAPLDQQRPFRGGEELAGPGEELAAGDVRHPLVGEHQGDLVPPAFRSRSRFMAHRADDSQTTWYSIP